MVRKLRNRSAITNAASAAALILALAGGTAYGATTADDRLGDRKAQGLGPIGERTSNTPDVPGEPVVDESGSAGIAESPAPVGDSAALLRSAVDDNGSVRLIVTMAQDVTVEADLTTQQVSRQRAAIETRLDSLDEILAGTASEVITEFTVVPAAVAIADAEGLEALLADPKVAALTLDREAPMALDVSTGVIDSDLLNTAGTLGNNYEGSGLTPNEVAVLDSGVDNQHTAFAGRIVAQACFAAGNFCPNGTSSQSGAGAGDNCTYSTQCDHGTHVGGIAAGSFFTGGHEGVARGANIVAVQVGHPSTTCATGEPNPCWRYFFSDLDLALQHVLNLRNGGRRIVAVNLSLGGPLHTSEATCGSTFPNTQNLAANLQTAGVAVVAATGNDGSTNSVTYPSCLPSAFAVAATDDSDVPAGFSNNSTATNWWAPGVSIDAPITTSTTAKGLKSGTSQAAPHVSGALALVRECVDGNGVPISATSAVSALNNTGVNITHDGVTRRRINALDAATSFVNNNDFAAAENIGANTFNDFDFTVCSDTEPGEPTTFSQDNGVWWTWTPTIDGIGTISTEDGGGNVTTFDTTLSVFTGNTLAGLTTYALDDDSGTGLRSLVAVPVKAGTTYRIKVDGFGAANGLLNLHTQVDPAMCQGVAVTILGSNLGETINGTPGNDVILTGAGNDIINPSDGNDRICSGAGDDDVGGGNGDDTVFGGPGADAIGGGEDNDTLVGNAGGGDTNDVGDTINGARGNDFIDGWVGDDVLTGGPGDDALRGEAGVDVVRYVDSAAGVTADLGAGTATGDGNDTFVAVEKLVGSDFRDRFTGSAEPNTLAGGAGNDSLDGRGGPDILNGQDGRDTASYATSAVPVTVDLDDEADDGAAGELDNVFSTVENIRGGQAGDRLTGSASKNLLIGGLGVDIFSALAGVDRIKARDTADDGQINCGADNDTVIADALPDDNIPPASACELIRRP